MLCGFIVKILLFVVLVVVLVFVLLYSGRFPVNQTKSAPLEIPGERSILLQQTSEILNIRVSYASSGTCFLCNELKRNLFQRFVTVSCNAFSCETAGVFYRKGNVNYSSYFGYSFYSKVSLCSSQW